MKKLETAIDCEVFLNQFKADYFQHGSPLTNEQLIYTVSAMVSGGERFKAMEVFQQDDQFTLRMLAIPTIVNELKRRYEVAELEDAGNDGTPE